MRGLSLNIDHRYRRLRRNARHIAPNELVQHYIAEHDDITLAHLMKNSFRLAAKITLIAGHTQHLSTNPSLEEFGSPWPPAKPGRKLSSADLKVALLLDHPINRRDHALYRQAPDAFGLFKLSAEIPGAWLARHIFEYYFVWVSRPRPPMRAIRRTENHYAGRGDRSSDVCDAAVVPD